ncbi:MAG: type VII toxin-antitoxin system HepT family RNase toxin [Promethearchaeia archaeon]
MDKDRLLRYKEKLEYLKNTVGQLQDWTGEVEKEDFLKESGIQKRYSIYHAFQIAVEIISDLVAMIVKDESIIPKDDYSNIEILKKKKTFKSDVCAKLKEANGLRNRIVHDYNGLDDSIAYERIFEHINIFKKFEKEIKTWIKRKSQDK